VTWGCIMIFMENQLRRLPSVDRLLNRPEIKALADEYPHDTIVQFIRENLAALRSGRQDNSPPPEEAEIAAGIVKQAENLLKPQLRLLINATGVVLHTNLGRAPLSRETITAMQSSGTGYNNLEFDLESGDRGSRHSLVEEFLCRMSGAEAGLVVNNNASAVMLGLSALANKKEVIVSRGQAVEIGGGFRVPEVMRQSGAKLVEVGTTNCTYIQDYELAISPRTAALLRVHASNFQVVGFTHMVTLAEMVQLAHSRELPVFDDLGSGCPLDTAQFGMSHEPTIQESIAAGVDLAFFSGDKLLGGPQAGIVVGKKSYIDKLKKHPLMRALRVDKTRLAGLSATLLHYIKGEATRKIPVWQMISQPLPEIKRRAGNLAAAVSGKVIEGESVIGGGSLPGVTLPTYLVTVGDVHKPAFSRDLSYKLRKLDVPVITRLSEGLLIIDPRTVFPEQDALLIKSLINVLHHS
jgi:L-seryl-tRNA(Ser) seleniumtransferase